ncbi:MAG: hypothetical protein ACK4TB_06155 [Gemmobacter sp.]
MTRRGEAEFVAPETYRRRRLIDAARILPFAALLFMMLPLAWDPAEPGGGRDTAGDTVYLFVLWAVLIAAAAALAPALGRVPPEGQDD